MRTPRGWLLLAAALALVSLGALAGWARLPLPKERCRSSAGDCSETGRSAWAAPLELLTFAAASGAALALAVGVVVLIARRRQVREAAG